ATVATLAVAAIWIARVGIGRSRRSGQHLKDLRVGLPSMGVQIICGDCSGQGLHPIKTYMDRWGSCETCGGNSYMLASRRGSELDHKRRTVGRGQSWDDRKATGKESEKSGRLLAFGTSAGRRSAN